MACKAAWRVCTLPCYRARAFQHDTIFLSLVCSFNYVMFPFSAISRLLRRGWQLWRGWLWWRAQLQLFRRGSPWRPQRARRRRQPGYSAGCCRHCRSGRRNLPAGSRGCWWRCCPWRAAQGGGRRCLQRRDAQPPRGAELGGAGHASPRFLPVPRARVGAGVVKIVVAPVQLAIDPAVAGST